MQDKNIELGTKDYYGGLYDEYGIMIGVAPKNQVNNKDKWFVYQYITKGMHTKQAPKLQKAHS